MPRCIAHMGLSDLRYVASGFGIGLLVGLTGVGGGSLTTPLLVLIFGISPTVAVGTDLLFAAITKSVGALVHGVKQTLDWRITTRLWAGSLPGAALTLWLLYAFSAPRHTYPPPTVDNRVVWGSVRARQRCGRHDQQRVGSDAAEAFLLHQEVEAE